MSVTSDAFRAQGEYLAGYGAGKHAHAGKALIEAADALEAQEARVAELEKVATAMLDQWQQGADGDDVFALYANMLKQALTPSLPK